MTHEEAAADVLQRLYRTYQDAAQRLDEAEKAVKVLQRETRIAWLRYKRQALWIKADELRRQLEQTEAQAAAIKLDND